MLCFNGFYTFANVEWFIKITIFALIEMAK